MSEPFLRVRLLDERGTVHVDRLIGVDDVDTALDHGEIANQLAGQGLRWRLEITDPDDDIGPVVLEGGPR